MFIGIRNSNLCSRAIFSKVNRRLYSQVYDDVVKFSENIHHNEFKVPSYEKCYSIFFNENDKLSDLQSRIKGSDEKIQQVEFINWENDQVEDNVKYFTEIKKNPFKIRINNHLTIKYVPSLNLAVLDLNHEYNITNKYNNFLFSQFSKEDILSNTKTQVEKRLNNLLKLYEKLLEEYKTAEKMIQKRYKEKTKLYINLGFLFFVIHSIVFYVLIYQLYGWDTIEPITYIVGNVYWIVGLMFFISKKKKLDFSYFSSSGFKKNFLSMNARRLGYSSKGKLLIEEEIAEISKFKLALNNKI